MVLQASFQILREILKGLRKKKKIQCGVIEKPMSDCISTRATLFLLPLHLHLSTNLPFYQFLSSLLLEFKYLSFVFVTRKYLYITTKLCVWRSLKHVCSFYNRVIFSACHHR